MPPSSVRACSSPGLDAESVNRRCTLTLARSTTLDADVDRAAASKLHGRDGLRRDMGRGCDGVMVACCLSASGASAVASVSKLSSSTSGVSGMAAKLLPRDDIIFWSLWTGFFLCGHIVPRAAASKLASTNSSD